MKRRLNKYINYLCVFQNELINDIIDFIYLSFDKLMVSNVLVNEKYENCC